MEVKRYVFTGYLNGGFISKEVSKEEALRLGNKADRNWPSSIKVYSGSGVDPTSTYSSDRNRTSSANARGRI